MALTLTTDGRRVEEFGDADSALSRAIDDPSVGARRDGPEDAGQDRDRARGRPGRGPARRLGPPRDRLRRHRHPRQGQGARHRRLRRQAGRPRRPAPARLGGARAGAPGGGDQAAARAARQAVRLRGDHRRLGGDGAGLRRPPQGRADEDERPDHRRVGDGQGARRERAPPQLAAPSARLRGAQLRRDPEGDHRVGALRAREGRLHRGAREADGADRAGPRRHALPRRGLRDAARPAGEVPARPRGAARDAGRRERLEGVRLPPRLRDEPRPEEGDRGRALPAGPLLPAQGGRRRPPRAPRTARGRAAPRRALPRGLREGARPPRHRASPPRPSRPSWRTPGPGTSAR